MKAGSWRSVFRLDITDLLRQLIILSVYGHRYLRYQMRRKSLQSYHVLFTL